MIAKQKSIRILIVAPAVEMVGGQAIQAARLFEQLTKEPGLDVSLLPINPPFPRIFQRWQSIKYIRSLRTSILYWLALLKTIPRYDIIHIFAASYFSFLISPTPAIVVAKLFGKRVVLNYRSGEAEDHLASWKRTAIPVLKLADALVVPSGYLVEVFDRFGLNARSIPNVIDVNQYSFRERARLRPVFLSNRNLDAMYNVSCVLQAFHIVQQQFPEANLTVAGEGAERARLERLSKELELRNVSFPGRVSGKRMVELYEQADIYLNGSNIDNMPTSLIEAFASGLPVVTTNAGGIPYFVEHERTGLMVERGDFQDMALQAIRLLNDQSLANVIIRNAKQECMKYTWGSVRDSWLELYGGLVDQAATEQQVLAQSAATRERI